MTTPAGLALKGTLAETVMCAMAELAGCQPVRFDELCFEVKKYSDAKPTEKAALVQLTFLGEVRHTVNGWALRECETSIFRQ